MRNDVARKLDEVNLGRLTIQTMIFEPGPLVRLELADLLQPAGIGGSPSAKASDLLECGDLSPLF